MMMADTEIVAMEPTKCAKQPYLIKRLGKSSELPFFFSESIAFLKIRLPSDFCKQIELKAELTYF